MLNDDENIYDYRQFFFCFCFFRFAFFSKWNSAVIVDDNFHTLPSKNKKKNKNHLNSCIIDRLRQSSIGGHDNKIKTNKPNQRKKKHTKSSNNSMFIERSGRRHRIGKQKIYSNNLSLYITTFFFFFLAEVSFHLALVIVCI